MPDQNECKWIDNLLVGIKDVPFQDWFREWVRGELMMIRAIVGTREFDEDHREILNFQIKDRVNTSRIDKLSNYGMDRRQVIMKITYNRRFPAWVPEGDPYKGTLGWGASFGYYLFPRLAWLGWTVEPGFVELKVNEKTGKTEGTMTIEFRKTIPEVMVTHIFDFTVMVPKYMELDLMRVDSWKEFDLEEEKRKIDRMFNK